MLPFYNDSTMWGPQGNPNQERPRLKPGDRMADGRIFMGDNPEVVLLAELARLDDAIRPLDQRRNEVLAKLSELNPEKYGQVVTAQVAETAPAAPAASPKTAKVKRG